MALGNTVRDHATPCLTAAWRLSPPARSPAGLHRRSPEVHQCELLSRGSLARTLGCRQCLATWQKENLNSSNLTFFLLQALWLLSPLSKPTVSQKARWSPSGYPLYGLAFQGIEQERELLGSGLRDKVKIIETLMTTPPRRSHCTLTL